MPRGRRRAAEPVEDAGGEEDAPASSLSNLTPETFQEHYRNIRRAKREADEAVSVYRAARKSAEGAGCDLKVLGMLEQLAKLDEGEADARLTKLFKYAGWLSLPIGTQINLFDPGAEHIKPEADDTHRQWAANEAGIAVGKSGGAREDNPFAPGSPLHAEWDSGWRGGKDVADHLAKKTGTKAASQTRKRREPATPTVEDQPAGNA